MKKTMINVLKRFKSPVVWLSIVAIIYNVIAAEVESLPDWTCIVGYITVLFGITNNPTDSNNF